MQSTNGDYTFAVCLSHDVDRIYKTYQYFTEVITDREPLKWLQITSANNPWWQFERIMSLEQSLGVYSSFNILDEQSIYSRPKRQWFSPRAWKLFAGRYDVTDSKFRSMLKVLSANGWEIGLQGSYLSSTNPGRFKLEKERIERSAGCEVLGNRQHYLRHKRTDTWRHLRDCGIRYDTSLADRFQLEPNWGYELCRPFDDEFVVFPWTVMDFSAINSGEDFATALSNCEQLLEKFREQQSVLVLDWHQRVFYESDFPRWDELYEALIQRALNMGAWVGPPGEFYRAIPQPTGTVTETLEQLSMHDD